MGLWLYLFVGCCLALIAALWWLVHRLGPGIRGAPAIAPSARPRYPVVLVHGVMGFDEIAVLGRRREYFRGIAEHLERLGIATHRPTVPPLSSVPRRAERLAAFIDRLGAERVNLIAHSMGGLDARYAITKLGAHRRVASLITIGTPHRGTPIADLGHNFISKALMAVLHRAGFDLKAIEWLTPERLGRFNEDVPDAPGVFYGHVVSIAHAGRRRLHPALKPSHLYLKKFGESDGLVPAASQVWGEQLAVVETDHWGQIGWSDHFDAPRLYEDLMQALVVRHL